MKQRAGKGHTKVQIRQRRKNFPYWKRRPFRLKAAVAVTPTSKSVQVSKMLIEIANGGEKADTLQKNKRGCPYRKCYDLK